MLTAAWHETDTGTGNLLHDKAGRSVCLNRRQPAPMGSFFSPTAQWCARTTVLSIMSAVVSRSTTAASVMEAGKRRLAGDTARAATTGEVQDLRREARALKECVVDLTLENRLLKKRMARP
ncbi:hypothetical protein LZC13_09310, partial [Campylobacter coli]|nr:hypothetical protein [Campylobacter coli]